jgi:DNA-binding CsgD family transcriptional regulator
MFVSEIDATTLCSLMFTLKSSALDREVAKKHENEEFSFGGEPDPSLSREYKNNPTIENYLSLRRANPNAEIEVAFTSGLDWLFANENLLRENGINPQWFASALDANEEAISKLSLHLLDKIVDRSRLEKSGETHVMSRGVAISDSLVNYLIAAMLDALSWNDDLYIPRDLLVLTRYQILGDGPAQLKQLESHQLEHRIAYIGAQILEQGRQVTTREIAKILNINASTVSRIFPGDKLKIESERRLEMTRGFHKSQAPFADMRAKKRD